MMNLRVALQNPKVLWVLLALNLNIWVLVIMPSVYVKGLSNSLVSLKSSPYSIFTCLVIFLSFSILFLFFMYKVQTHLLGPLLLSERQLVFANLMKDNPGLQLLLILMHEPFRNSVESLIWSIVFLIYAWSKAGCVLTSSRLNDNKLKNLEIFNFTVFSLTISLLTTNFCLFSNSTLWIFTLLNLESIFIIKDCLLAHYQLSSTRTISASTEIKLEIFENLLKFGQWVQVGLTNGSIISTNPVEFLLMIKLQTYAVTLFHKCTQFFRYRSSIHQFTEKYPPLSSKDLEELGDEKCCVCWDSLSSATSCKITCGHVIHVECIWKWMLRNTERKCPLCKQSFLEPNQGNGFSLLSVFSFFARRTSEEDLRRLAEVFPNLSEHELLREIERAGSVQEVIDNLLGD